MATLPCSESLVMTFHGFPLRTKQTPHSIQSAPVTLRITTVRIGGEFLANHRLGARAKLIHPGRG